MPALARRRRVRMAWLGLVAGVVGVACLSTATAARADAPAFAPVSGSPFATGAAPYSVAFSASGNLLATADQTDNTVSVFSVGSDGALTEVTGSPFATGSSPISMAFSASGNLLATANQGDQHGVGVLGRVRGALTEVSGSPFATGSYPVLGGVQRVGEPAGHRQLQRQHGVGVLGRVRGGADPGAGARRLPPARYPYSVAFSASGNLLATANQRDNTVSVFSVGSGGALTAVPGSPFATGSFP